MVILKEKPDKFVAYVVNRQRLWDIPKVAPSIGAAEEPIAVATSWKGDFLLWVLST